MERVLRDEEEDKQSEQEETRRKSINKNNKQNIKSNKNSFEQLEERLEVERTESVCEKGGEGEEVIDSTIDLTKQQQLSNNKLVTPPEIDQQSESQFQLQQQSTTNNQQLQLKQAPIQKLKSKITHRSQSSPSSLTTHKFGLRPTPSPPRLIIDHQTGDIVESYPDQPIFLRTYQPLDIGNDDTTNTTNTTFNDDNTIDDSITHPYPPPLNNLQQFEQYNQQLLAEQYSAPAASAIVAGGQRGGGQQSRLQQQLTIDDDEQLNAIMSQQQNRNSFRPVIPPPHSASGKVYFAQPNTNVDHLFNHSNQTNHQLQQQPFTINQQNQVATTGGGNQLTDVDLSSSQSIVTALSGSHNNSFKKALNKLTDSNKTDIALIATDDGNEDVNSIRKGNSNSSKIKITATNASKANALMHSTQQHKKNQLSSANKYQQLDPNQQQQHHHHPRVVPSIEDFKLYNLCYNFRILLVILLSSFIIYLLVVPLNLDCTLYRPTYTYISIIVASVNLICIFIFTLFWYCSGVTRTLYANLSSSAFIITIYSILVAVNLALAILFFFINTCHFHKLISTTKPTTLALHRDSSEFQHLLLDNNENRNFNNLLNSEEFVEFKLTEDNVYENDRLFSNSKRSTNELLNTERKNDISIDSNMNNNINNNGKNRDSNSNIYKHSNSYVTTIKKLGGLEIESHPVRRHRRDDGNDLSGIGNKDESVVKINHNENNIDNGDNQDSLINSSPQENSLPLDGGNIMHHPHNHHHHHHDLTTSPYAMSPIEAFWEYLKEQVVLFKRSFYRFLTNYDLRFIGALHALCAICLQYMAMKVAVVRSYFCSPVGAYI